MISSVLHLGMSATMWHSDNNNNKFSTFFYLTVIFSLKLLNQVSFPRKSIRTPSFLAVGCVTVCEVTPNFIDRESWTISAFWSLGRHLLVTWLMLDEVLRSMILVLIRKLSSVVFGALLLSNGHSKTKTSVIVFQNNMTLVHLSSYSLSIKTLLDKEEDKLFHAIPKQL